MLKKKGFLPSLFLGFITLLFAIPAFAADGGEPELLVNKRKVVLSKITSRRCPLVL